MRVLSTQDFIQSVESCFQIHAAIFSGNLTSGLLGKLLEVTVADSSPELVLDGGTAIHAVNRLSQSTGESLTLGLLQDGDASLGFRAPDSGQLLGILPLTILAVADVQATGHSGGFVTADGAIHGAIYHDRGTGLLSWVADFSECSGLAKADLRAE